MGDRSKATTVGARRPDETALQRMVRQIRALADDPCEFAGEACYGCSTCFARQTVRILKTEIASGQWEKKERVDI